MSRLNWALMLMFCIWVGFLRNSKSEEVGFLKKRHIGSGGLKMAQKLHFDKSIFHSYVKVLMVLKLYAKTIWLRKIWFLSYAPKTSRLIRVQDSLNYNISQTCWWIGIFVCNYTSLSGCGQECMGMPKVMPNSELASSQEWVELWLFFCMWFGICRS